MASTKKKVVLMNAKLASELEKRKKLKHSELFVLDNSLRESTVGQLRGHTLENKWEIYHEVSKSRSEYVNCRSVADISVDWRQLQICRIW
jgi:hypothetical protein